MFCRHRWAEFHEVVRLMSMLLQVKSTEKSGKRFSVILTFAERFSHSRFHSKTKSSSSLRSAIENSSTESEFDLPHAAVLNGSNASNSKL